jgi:hypothetical protein
MLGNVELIFRGFWLSAYSVFGDIKLVLRPRYLPRIVSRAGLGFQPILELAWVYTPASSYPAGREGRVGIKQSIYFIPAAAKVSGGLIDG